MNLLLPAQRSSRSHWRLHNLALGRGPCPRKSLEIDLSPWPCRVGFEGWFTVELICKHTGRVKQRLEFKNVITNTAIDGYLGGASNSSPIPGTLANYLGVGTSSVEPNVTDTSLGSALTPRTNSNGGFGNFETTPSYVAGPPEYRSNTGNRLFEDNQVNGNLTELGFFNTSSSGRMWNRQLFRDAEGDPVTVTKTSDEQLRVTYTIRAYTPDDIVDVININGVDYDFTLMPQWVNGQAWASFLTTSAAAGAISSSSVSSSANILYEPNTVIARTGTLSGTNASASSSVWDTYTNGNFYRDTIVTWNPGVGNFATGVGSIGLTPFIANERAPIALIFHTTKLPKDNTKRLVVNARWQIDRP